jgi:hypothetical protein
MKTAMILAAGLLGLASTPALAQAGGTLTHFTRDEFEAALRDAGATITSPRTAERIDFTFNDGVLADALLMACEDNEKKTNCLGSSMLATFTPDDGTTEEQIVAAINTYNYRENFGRAYTEPDGTIAVRMYIIADGGITRENYRRQIGLWFGSVVDFFGYLYGE